MSHYGHFSKLGDEYIILRPDTPKPWVNYLTNGKYCALVSATGGGYSFIGDAGYNRILEEHAGEELISDRPGRYIFIRDNDTEEFWGMTWQPCCKEMDSFEARHGLGYTSVHTSKNGLEGKVTYFVPRNDPCELWMSSITNNTRKKKNLSIFVYVEWSLGNHLANSVEASFNDLFNDLDFEDGVIYASKRRWERPDALAAPWDKVAFLTINQSVDGFDCFKEKFVGMYGSIINPKAVREGKCTGSQGDGHHAAGALQKNIKLEPGKSFVFDVTLGIEYRKNYDLKKYEWADGGRQITKDLVKKYKDHKKVAQAYDEMRVWWKNYTEQSIVKTPDRNFDISFNYWDKYQAWMTTQWSLMDSYYIGGGATYGFRDMCQHILGTLPNDISFSKERTMTLLGYQFREGKTVHNWDALLKKGVVTNHSDDPQWLAMATINYIVESGEISFLYERITYQDVGDGSVLEHVINALEYTIRHSSSRNIPHRGRADWNDALTGGQPGKGESQMVANQLCWNLREFAKLLRVINQPSMAERYEEIYEKIKKSLNKYFWDGKWYIRATNDGKETIGSSKNDIVKIDINAQTWAVIAGTAEKERGKQAMDSVWKHLMTEYGPVMFVPPFKAPSSKYGIISQFTPGTKENGAIFNHPASWAVVAECLLGRGDKAYEIWRRTSFTTRGKNPELYRVEPFVYAEFIFGPVHPEFGRGSFTWTTGSASWFWRACLDNICGVQPTLEGLRIDPCVPKDWDKFEVKRHFRGAGYHIKVQNPLGVSKGVASIKVDGQKIEGNILPVFPEGEHLIEVLMG